MCESSGLEARVWAALDSGLATVAGWLAAALNALGGAVVEDGELELGKAAYREEVARVTGELARAASAGASLLTWLQTPQ